VKIFLRENVYEAALARMRWLFDEFEHVHVNFSGGKDSTVLLNLAMQVAAERGRLPLPVTFIDQEAEWDCVIDYVRAVMADPRVAPRWYQVPIKLFNATSAREPWLYCWQEGAPWIRAKEPTSIQANVYGTDRFTALFEAIFAHDYPTTPAVYLAGVRCEESPGRFQGLTSYETYGGVTWGRVSSKARGHYTFYPLYDWSYLDIWKAIHDHRWAYCRLYDLMYQYGIPTREMRVSNVHHETAVRTLYFLQEVEPETWDRVTARLAGVQTAGILGRAWQGPKELPPMFADWREYRDYLVEHLIVDPAHQAWYRKHFAQQQELFIDAVQAELIRMEIAMLLVNDHHGTKTANFHASHGYAFKNRGRISGRRSA
jgi:predicted phosphoadenosine phosphosulfate sulfurtransferase